MTRRGEIQPETQELLGGFFISILRSFPCPHAPNPCLVSRNERGGDPDNVEVRFRIDLFCLLSISGIPVFVHPCAQSLSHVQLFANPMDCSPPGSSVHGIFQATGADCHFLLQGIIPTQRLNPGLPPCRQILYHLRHQGSPRWLFKSQVQKRRGMTQQQLPRPLPTPGSPCHDFHHWYPILALVALQLAL